MSRFFRIRNLGETAGMTDGSVVLVDRQYWESLPRWGKICLVAHELRHVWQAWGINLAPVTVLATTVAVAGILLAHSVLATLIATVCLRWLYVAIRSELSVSYAELDAVRFEYWIACMTGRKKDFVADRLDMPAVTVFPEYREALAWLRRRGR